MKRKQSGKKVLDIAKPKKRTAATTVPSAPKLAISKRSIIVDAPDDTEDKVTDAPEPIQTKRVVKVIEPSGPAPADSRQPSASAAPKPTEPAPAPPTPKQPQAAAEPESIPKEPAAHTPEEPEQSQQTAQPEQQAKASPQDAKRQQQIQGYIENREFYVPINAVARKRSLKVSFALTFLELVLGVILINLMLDAGLIQLLEKIPHTNFFGLN